MASRTIDDLPDEILIEIFSYCDTELSGNPQWPIDMLTSLALVCKRWEYLAINFFKFKTNKFFDKSRSEDDKQVMMNSSRRFRILHFSPNVEGDSPKRMSEKFQKRLKDFQNLREKYNGYYEGVKFSIGILENNDALEDEIFNFRGKDFETLLDSACNVKELHLRLSVVRLFNYQFKTINFNNLTTLNVYGELTLDQNFLLQQLDFLQLDNLKVFYFEGNSFMSERIATRVLNFASKIEKLSLFQIKWPMWKFRWTPRKINMLRVDNVQKEIKKFLKGRMGCVKTLQIRPAVFDWAFISSEAKLLEKLKTEGDLMNLSANFSLPNVKFLWIEGMQVSEVNIRKLKDITPNLETIQLFVPKTFENINIWEFRMDAGFIPLFFEVIPTLKFIDPIHKYESFQRYIDNIKRQNWDVSPLYISRERVKSFDTLEIT